MNFQKDVLEILSNKIFFVSKNLNFLDEVSFIRSVVSTKCRLDEMSFDEVSFRRSVF